MRERMLAVGYAAAWLAALLALTLAVSGPDPPPPQPLPFAPPPPVVAVRFAPGPDCEAEIVARLAAARRSVRVLAYSFTSEPIALALVGAKLRGVDVAVVIDRDEAAGRGNRVAMLRGCGISTRLDAVHPIMHDKVIIVDGSTVLTGSYNYSAQAGRNAENLLTIGSSPVAAAYLADWERHAAHAIP
jgi:phosphatidylserine/phosphatidylglycerophosphate/cardiolipin synthase-like enzyme